MDIVVIRALAIMTLVACSQPRTYHCTADLECVFGNVPGRCERDGFCSFPDVTCPSGSRYGDHATPGVRGVCVEQVGNDACARAESIVLGDEVIGDQRGAGSTGLLTCSQTTSDVFYALELAECSDLTIRAEAPGANLAVGLIRQCTEAIACGDASATSTPELLEIIGLAAGTYQVAVGGVFYDEEFTLSTQIAPAPLNDTFATASALPSSLSQAQSLARAADDLMCGGRSGGRDLFYQLVLPPDQATTRWVVDVAAMSSTSTDLAVALLDTNGQELGCQLTGTGPTRFYDLPPGNYVLAVDGPTDGSCGQFNLGVTTTQVLDNNRCTNAFDLGVVTPTTAPISKPGDLDEATNEYIGGCGGTGNDLVYELTLDHPAHLDIRVTELTGGFTPIVYMRAVNELDDPSCATAPQALYRKRGTCSPTLVVADLPDGELSMSADTCATHPSSAHLDMEAVQPGKYQIVVDSEDGAGTFRLEVRTVAPIGEDRPGPFMTGDIPRFGDCFAGDPFVDPALGPVAGCCDVGSSMGASSDGSACVTGPDVYRTIAVPAGCAISGIVTVTAATEHQVSVATSSACPTSPVCSGPAVLVNGLYRSSVAVSAIAGAGSNCLIEVRVVARFPPSDRRQFVVRYQNSELLACQPP